MIDPSEAKLAATKAFSFIQDLYGDVDDLMLEGVELQGSQKTWIITVSFATPHPASMVAIGALLNPKSHREYKVLHVQQVGAGKYEVQKMTRERLP